MAEGFTHEAPAQGATNEWYTPPHIFKALGEVFDLDPCASYLGTDFTPAKTKYTKFDDGLVQDWGGLFWFCNPPYGKETAKWVDKMIANPNGIALLFARTDTKWFKKMAENADLVLFTEGRIRFVSPDGVMGGSPGAGSVFFGFGERAKTALLSSGLGLSFELVRG